MRLNPMNQSSSLHHMDAEFCIVSPRRAHGVADSVHGRMVRLPREANMTRSGQFREILGIFLCYDGHL